MTEQLKKIETTEQLPTHFKPRLGLLDATMIVAGSIVGSEFLSLAVAVHVARKKNK